MRTCDALVVGSWDVVEVTDASHRLQITDAEVTVVKFLTQFQHKSDVTALICLLTKLMGLVSEENFFINSV